MPDAAPTPEDEAPKARAPRRWPRFFAQAGLGAFIGVLVLAVALFAGLRFGVLLPQARVMIEARADGIKVGRFGRIKVEGLSGDVWRDLSIRKLTIRDEQGVWLQADNVRMKWRYLELLRRNFHADSIDIQTIRILRRPTLSPKGVDRGLPVSFHIGKARSRVEMLPAFSYERGVYDLNLQLDVARRGGQRGELSAKSVLHPGDHLDVKFDLARKRPLVLLADASEARGGALAGALGLPADQVFSLKIVAGGRMSEGEFSAVAQSGATRPLQAAGRWDPQGGLAQGRLLLDASRLTQRYAARVGDTVGFAIAGVKAPGDQFALEARVRADNLRLSASGLGDIGKRKLGHGGMTLIADSPKLSRVIGAGPEMGAARVAGRFVLTGRSGWAFNGNAAVQDAHLGGYVIGRAAGPLEIARDAKELSVESRLAAAGGRGEGWIAAALGPTPSVAFEGARLADGRLLMRDLDLKGAGLTVEASGGRSLLGGLSLKGQAVFANLSRARPGASGSASADFSATQAKAGEAWTLSADLRGDRFATGYRELDRLLGAKPQLQVKANYHDRRIAVGEAKLSGAALNATSAGVMAPDGALTFKLDWNAQGPFRAGPVEITGKAKGSGAITGTAGAPRADLIAELESIDLPRLPLKAARVTLSFLRKPDGSSGMVAITADSAYGPARGRADFRFPQGGVELANLSVDAGGAKASGYASLRNGAPSTADLDVRVVQGAFLDTGKVAGQVKIADAPGGPVADLNLAAENAKLPGMPVSIRAGRIQAQGPLSRLPYTARAQGASSRGAWSFDGRGQIAQLKPGYQVTFDGMGKLGDRDVHTVETASFHFGGAERSARLRLAASGGGFINVDGSLTDGLADIRAEVKDLGLGMVNEDLAGQVDATLNVQGKGERLEGVMQAKLVGARGRGAPESSGIDGALNARLAGDTLTLDLDGSNRTGLKANANLVLPTETSAAPFRVAIARQRPMRGRYFAEGEVRPLWDLLVGGERSLAGQVHTEGTLGGTLADPQAVGHVTVANGQFDDGATGLSLRKVALRADFAQSAVDVSQMSGEDGHGGTITGSGRVSLARDGASSFRLDLRGFRLIDNDMATASATGQATINRDADGKVRLAGALTIDRADIAADPPIPSGVVAMDVVEKNRPLDLPSTLAAPAVRRGAGWTLDVTLKAPRRVFLRGRGLDVEMSLDAHVGGTTARPNLTGVARLVRGDYDFAGKRFEFDPTSVVYLSTRPDAIRLELTATRDDPSLTAVVKIRGTAARPEITLTSTPVLPNDEVLAQVLFGRSASQLSPLEAAQLASALTSLAGGGGFDVIGNLRNFARLDRLSFGGDASSGVTVAGGKYLTEDVYLELSGGGREGPAAQVEWRVRRHLSIISRLANQGDGRLAVRWRKDY